MSKAFAIRLLISRMGRGLLAGLLSSLVFLSIPGPLVLLGLAFDAGAFASTMETNSGERPASEWEAPVSPRHVTRHFRRTVGEPKISRTLAPEFQRTATYRVSPTHVRQMLRTCEHDRRNGIGAPLRC
jgi:hypothetical protein